MACVRKLNFLFGSVGDHVKRGGDKGLIDPLQDRTETQIERAQKTSRVLHYSSKFLQQSPNDGGYQRCAQTMSHDVADENTRAILRERKDVEEINAYSRRRPIAMGEGKGTEAGPSVIGDRRVSSRQKSQLDLARHA